GRLVKVRRTKIRCPVRIGGHTVSKALKPSSTNRFEWGMIAVQCRLFVKEYRNLQLRSYSLPQSLRQVDTILHRRAAQRHKRHNIRCSHPRMDAFVLPKIDEIGRHTNGAKGRFGDGSRFARKT